MTRLEGWNTLAPNEAAAAILPCSGSAAWAAAMAAARPLADEAALLAASEQAWAGLAREDWQQAFSSHPRIGERKPQSGATAQSLAWSDAEQSEAMLADQRAKAALAEANAHYEARFSQVFLIYANGRSTAEILAELERRLAHTPEAEWQQAQTEQMKITALRLRRWLEGS